MDLNELDEFIVKVNSVSDAVETVRVNIQERRASFMTNERQTRSGLIDPILRTLGWDVSQVDFVKSEYRTSSSGTADYALFDGSDPIALIEAKRLGKSLNVRIVEQLADYTRNENTVRFAIFTNGDRWRMRETGKSVTVIDIHLSNESPLKSALELMRLEREILLNVRGEMPRHKPETEGAKPDSGQGRSNTSFEDGSEKGTATKGLDEGWVTLSELVRNRGKTEGTRTRIPIPKRMRFPGRAPIDSPRLRDIWSNWALWLSEEIQDPARWQSIDETLPDRVRTLAKRIRQDESGFRGKAYRLPNGWFIDMGIAGQRDMWLAIDYSSQHFGIDLDVVHVSF